MLKLALIGLFITFQNEAQISNEFKLYAHNSIEFSVPYKFGFDNKQIGRCGWLQSRENWFCSQRHLLTGLRFTRFFDSTLRRIELNPQDFW